MKLHRFFIEETLGNRAEITISTPEIIHQWRDVLRLGAGIALILIDKSGCEFLCEMAYITAKEGHLIIKERRETKNVPQREISLFVSLTKKDTFEWILQKGTELGVSRFIPLISDRSEKKDINIGRCKKIVLEAAEQSGRTILPCLLEPMSLRDVLEQYQIPSIVCDPRSDLYSISELKKISGVYIGPEGGWSDRELDFFKEKGISGRSLGSQILRTETAAIAVLSLILL